MRQTTDSRTCSKPSWWQRHYQRQIRPKGLENTVRRWRSLGTVYQGAGVKPDGDYLVYGMNATTLEIGQDARCLKGWIGLLGGAGLLTLIFMWAVLAGDIGFPALWRYVVSGDEWLFGAIFASALLLTIPMAYMVLRVVLTDLFGYTDKLVRFDRKRRKVWAFAGKQAPLEFDWDQLKPVLQTCTAGAFSVAEVHSVLLVDLDAQGEVKMEGWLPRIVRIGEGSVLESEALADYEYVRQFMDDGPNRLPPCKHYPQHKRNLREALNFGDQLTVAREFKWGGPDASPFSHIFLPLIIVGLLGTLLMLFSMAGYIASNLNRIPRWPQRIEAYAAEGGTMLPPPGAQPQNKPFALKEVPFILVSLGNVAALVWLFSLVGRG